MSLFNSLLLVIASASQKELARQVRYLKVENEMLRSRLPQRVYVTPKERQRLIKFATGLGRAIHQLATIVKPNTILHWIWEEKRAQKKRTKPAKPAKRGRRRTAEQIRLLVLKMARENTWGYARIVGELKKLGIRSLSKSTVRNILKAEGLDPCPKRAGATWDEFLKRHAASLWQCDFFSQKVLTLKGVRDAYFLAFLNVETRRVVLSEPTLHPTDVWATSQAETFVQEARAQGLPVRYLQRDKDSKYLPEFDHRLKRQRVTVLKGPKCAPNWQAFVERFIGSLRAECLHHFVFFGMQHLQVVAREWLKHYHADRPHQGKENELLTGPKRKGRPPKKPADEPIRLSDVRCRQRLGGLIKSYGRRAA